MRITKRSPKIRRALQLQLEIIVWARPAVFSILSLDMSLDLFRGPGRRTTRRGSLTLILILPLSMFLFLFFLLSLSTLVQKLLI